MREGVTLKTKLCHMCEMCVMLCYVLCYEQLNDDLRNRSKVWTVQS